MHITQILVLRNNAVWISTEGKSISLNTSYCSQQCIPCAREPQLILHMNEILPSPAFPSSSYLMSIPSPRLYSRYMEKKHERPPMPAPSRIKEGGVDASSHQCICSVNIEFQRLGNLRTWSEKLETNSEPKKTYLYIS